MKITLNADFDGDCLNILYVANTHFWEVAMLTFNPRNAMVISRNDGLFNNQMNLYKDILIVSNGIKHLGEDAYTEEDINNIKAIKERAKQKMLEKDY